MLDSSVKTGISNVRVLMRLPKDSRVRLALNFSQNKVIFEWFFVRPCCLFFLEQTKKSGHEQAAARSSVIKKLMLFQCVNPSANGQALTRQISSRE